MDQNLLTILLYLVRFYNVIIMLRVLMSWIPMDHDHALIRILFDITEPVLAPIRRLMHGEGGGGFDFSPIVVFILLGALDRALGNLLY